MCMFLYLCIFIFIFISIYLYKPAEADSGLVKLVVMTNVFFNNQQHEIKINNENRPLQKTTFSLKFSSSAS